MSRRTLAHLLLLATTLVWGATFVLVKEALADASPLVFNLARMAVASLALIALNLGRLRGVTRAQLAAGAAIGCLLAAGYQFQTLGLAYTTPAKSAFITGMVVVFVPLLSLSSRLRPPGSQRPGALAGAGIAIAFAGLFLLTTPAGTHPSTLLAGAGRGDWLTLACALAFAGHMLLLGRFSPGVPAGLLACLQVSACTLCMAVTLPLQRPHFHSTARLWTALAVCGLLATAAAFTVQSFAQQHLPPTHTVLLLSLEAVFALLTSWLARGEVLNRRSLAGAALILVAILVIELTSSVHTTEIPA